MINPQKSKIVLICGNVLRELSMLQLLKKEFEDSLNANVWIIGSLADIQKIYFSLSQIKPDVVFISQIVEKVTRDIASYVRKSGAILCVLPVEITYSRENYFPIFTNKQLYNKYVDYYFLPGERMYKDISSLSDINKNKMFITGTPKIDLYKNKNANKALSKRDFSTRHSIPKNKKNIFVFTSFVVTPSNYIKSEKAFKGGVNYLLKKSKETLEMRDIFARDIKKICADFPKCNIILKPHPLEDALYYKKTNKNFYMVKNVTFNDTINSIDLAIHWHSTVATECWVNGIKTLQYTPVVRYKSSLSDFDHGNPIYSNYSDLKKGISKYLNHNLDEKYLYYQKKYLKHCYYKTDGMSVKRIAFKIKNILRSNHRKVLNYVPRNYKLIYVFIIAEKILGIRLSRMLTYLFRSDYSWRYAADNFVFSPPISYQRIMVRGV